MFTCYKLESRNSYKSQNTLKFFDSSLQTHTVFVHLFYLSFSISHHFTMHSTSSSLSTTLEKGSQFSTVDLADSTPCSSRNSIIEKQEDDSTADAVDIPNGGLVAWLQVLGAFFLWFNTWYVSWLRCLNEHC